MSMSQVANYLAQTGMPEIANTVLPDRLTIEKDTVSAGPGGGQIKSAVTAEYSSVPCRYSPQHKDNKVSSADKRISIEEYLVFLPTHDDDGDRIALNETIHRLRIAANGDEPEKLMKIVAVRNVSGVMFEAACIKEN